MRNLKRVLSLALALVMMLGMMVIGANAASTGFADADEITYTEAVDVMSALKVLEGDGTNYNPTDILTREQATTIICKMLMGPENAKKLVGSSVFTDVAADRWSAGYISYCASLNILAGNGDDTFDPEGKLTGVAFAKMLLVALGYDPTIEGYVNNKNWATNIGTDAIDAGLNINGIDLAAPVTREQAAQMAFQALTATMVKYDTKGSTIIVNGIEIVNGASEAEPKTWGTTANSVDYTTGSTTANATDTVEFCEKYFPKLNLVSIDTDDFGRPAYTWYNGNRAVATNAVGTYADKADHTILVTKGGQSMAYWIDTVSKKYGDPVDTVWNNGSASDTLQLGDTIELFMNKTTANTVDKAVVTSVQLEKISKVTAVESSDYNYTVKIDGGRTYTDKTMPGFDAETMTKDTYVLVTYGTTDATVLNVEVAPYITGTMTASGTNYIKVDGTQYSYRAGYTVGSDFTNMYKFYQDNNGYVLGKAQVTYEDTNDGYVYLLDKGIQAYSAGSGLGIGGTEAKVNVKVVYMDGTVAVESYEIKQAAADITVDSGNAIGGTTIDKNDYYVEVAGTKYEVGSTNLNTVLGTNAFYAYSKNDDGKITLKALTAATDKTPATSTIVKDSTVIGSYTANSSTKLTVIDATNKKIAEYVGYKNFPSTAITNKPALVIVGKGSTIAKNVYVMDTVTSEDVTYAYYTGRSETRGTNTYYTFYVNGETVEYVLSSAPDSAYKVFTVNETAKTATGVSAAKGIVSGLDENFFLVSGDAAAKEYANTCKVWDLTGDKPVAGEVAEGDSVLFVTSGKVTVVFIVDSYVAEQPTTREEFRTLFSHLSAGYDKWYTLPTVGLSQTVDGSTIYFSGTLTNVVADDDAFNAVKAGLDQAYFPGCTSAAELKTYIDTNFTFDGVEKVGFFGCEVDGKTAVSCVVEDTAGNIKVLKWDQGSNTATTINWTTSTGVNVTFDISGLSF